MAGVGPEDLDNLAHEFLSACVESLDTIPTFAPGLGGAPERSFVSPGFPVDDCCDQLTVHATPVTESDTSPGGLAIGRRATFGRINLVTLIATIKRCIPVAGVTSIDDLPEIVDMETAAAQIHADGWALWNHIFNMIRNQELFALCDEVFWDGLVAVVPSGGCGGWTLTLRVALEGYEELPGS